ncbi:hypothetical protein FRB90_011520 [Tulasnella sp. 427]|nr:hypothetical protein FRB90_011520 [Tulasnella sp. 427]
MATTPSNASASAVQSPQATPQHTWSTSFSDDDSARAMDAHIPAFVSIFQDAAKYGDILSEDPEELSYTSSETSSISSRHTKSSEEAGGESDSVTPSGRVTPTTAEGDPEQKQQEAQHALGPSPDKIDKMMSKLMLNEQFKASTARLVGLSVNAFTQQGSPAGINVTSGETTSDAASDASVSSGNIDELNDRVVPLLHSSSVDVPYTSQVSGPDQTIKELKERIHGPQGLHSTVTVTVIQGFDAAKLSEDIKEAKERRIKTPATLDTSDQVVVDFGDLVIMDTEDDAQPEKATAGVGETHDPAEVARRMFGLAEEDDLWNARAAVGKFTLSAGYLVVTPRFVCFWSKGFISDTKLRFHAHDINSAHEPVEKRKCDGIFHRLVLEVKGHKDILFSFKSQEVRDDAIRRINAAAKQAKESMASKRGSQSSVPEPIATLVASSTLAATAPLATSPLSATPTSSTAPSATEQLASVSRILERSATRIIPTELLPHIPRAINIPSDKHYHIQKQHFVCLTIGSRGDVQPYIALCLGLQKEGHEVTIVTHEEYKAWVEGFGIQHRTAGGDPGALMKLSVEHKMFSPQFFKESLGNFRKWLDELLVDSFDQVKAAGATVLIESPSAMAGVHIAEALNIPYFRAFTMPWSRTAEYPHAFISPPDFVAGSFNFSTYVLFDNVFWRATAPQINPWRKKHLGLPSTDLEHMAQTKIPFLYNFSQHVVPKPLDWTDTTIITGYWFLDNPDLGWKPAQSLLDFMAKARTDGKPLVYIGFGSIVVEHPKAMTRSIVKAVLKSDVRAILNKGWSARMASNDNEPEVEIPPEVYEVDKIPHE